MRIISEVKKMYLKKQLNSEAKKVVVYLLNGLSEFKNQFIDTFNYYKDNTRIASPLSLLALVKKSKEKENKEVEVIKTFAPTTHIFKVKLKFPEDRNIYLEYINSIPNGYGVLEPVDGNGYSIEDFETYEGIITLVFYNEVCVDVRGRIDSETGEVTFSNLGTTSEIYGINSNKSKTK